MRKYDVVYDRYEGESNIVYRESDNDNWVVFDIKGNQTNARKVADALNKNAFFEDN